MRGRWSLAILGVVLILAGGLLAHFTQTAGGIRIEDVRFQGAKGNTMSALLYIPPNATPQIPAPGILAVHGYINSRETQDGFAIEFARRGYVVLALDQTGHGYSDGPAFANGFGGPDGLGPAILKQASWRWSLSALTFPHAMVRVLLAEQLYRAHSVLHNHPYHRE